jgi:hypothetical protein
MDALPPWHLRKDRDDVGKERNAEGQHGSPWLVTQEHGHSETGKHNA